MYHKYSRKEDRNYSKYFIVGEFTAKKKLHKMEGLEREARGEQWQEAPTALKAGDSAEVTRHRSIRPGPWREWL